MRLLDGIRVIDAASYIAGPVATTAMADFGADVIKIEPPSGDTYRTRGAGYPPSPHNFPWIVDNRNKRGVAIDLRVGRRPARAAAAGARAPTCSSPTCRSTIARRLRVRYEDLSPLNPRLVYGSVTAYGETGPEAAGRASTAPRSGRAPA